MQFVVFILGVIVGLIIRSVERKTEGKPLKEVISQLIPQKAQFIDAKPFKEKFEESNNITDLLQ